MSRVGGGMSSYAPLATNPWNGDWNNNSGLADLVDESNFVRAESMEIKNDPRFFQDNVLNKRLKAFATIAVCGTLLVKSSMHQIFLMNKHMEIFTRQGGDRLHFNGIVQLVAFCMLVMVFVINMVSVYVGVAQPYHTLRLMTAGPTGFEAAAGYYLNKNITAWRHMAIKYILLSMPLYMSQMGLRLVVKFDRDTEVAQPEPDDTPLNAKVESVSFFVFFLFVSCLLYSVHWKHFAVFRSMYETMAKHVTGGEFSQYVQHMNRASVWNTGTGGRPTRHLDV
jgi:hypothetical protein